MKYFFLIIFLVFSCASKNDVLLIQNSKNDINYPHKFEQITISPDDILKINVSSQTEELAQLFSFTNIQNSAGSNIENYQLNGFLVNSEGFIKIPNLTPVFVNGLTLSDASRLIEKEIRFQEDITNVSVDIKIVNSYFTVLGEVNKPGRYNFLENNMDLFQALGIAGDMTINGKRTDIKILRNIDAKYIVKSIDITSTDFLIANNYQIFPGDIIIVNPNKARIKNAGIIGNSGNLLSVLSFLLTSVILITSN